jgi:hypothetical protein
MTDWQMRVVAGSKSWAGGTMQVWLEKQLSSLAILVQS